MKNKTLFFLSAALVIYILALFINGYLLKLDFVLIGVIQELLTLPVVVLHAVLLIFIAIRLMKTGFLRDPYLYGSFSLLSISLFCMVGSFYVL